MLLLLTPSLARRNGERARETAAKESAIAKSLGVNEVYRDCCEVE